MERVVNAFCWMLLHSLWQGLLLAVLSALALQLTKKAGARLRYNLLLSLLGLFLLTCGCTFASALGAAPVDLTINIAEGRQNTLSQQAGGLRLWISAHTALLVFIWALSFLYKALRMVGGLLFLNRAKHKSVNTAPVYWQERLNVLASQLELTQAIRLLESGIVKTPMIIGHLKPLILVPVGLLSGLPPGQIEAMLLHELAHIKRNDYLVNLLQVLSEAVFCFNPGLLWVSALLRQEREHCCDEVALSVSANKKVFIEALISFKERALYESTLAVAFPGRKTSLLHRVLRISKGQAEALNPGDRAFVMASLAGLILLLASAAVSQAGISAVKQYALVRALESKAAAVSAAPKAHPKRYTKPKPPLVTVKPPVKPIAGKTKAVAADTAVMIRPVSPVTQKTQPVTERTAPVTNKTVPIQPVGKVDDP